MEDCLVLNVYARRSEVGSDPRPVMFFIHGGGFYSGSGNPDFYGPERFMNKDIVSKFAA